MSFIDIYSGWPEAFPVPDKSADNIVHLILEEIYPRYGCPLQILTDNGTENINKKVEDMLKELNINHITTSYYSPQGNGKVERFHRTLHDVMAKKLVDSAETWEIHLNQTLAAIRFHSMILQNSLRTILCITETTFGYLVENSTKIYGRRPT